MQRLFRIGATSIALVAGLAGLATTTGAAGTASAPPYSLKSSSVALKVTFAGTTFVGGTSSASAGSSTAPVAQGAGELSPAVVSSQQATASSPGTSQELSPSCAQPSASFPAPIGSLVGVGAGCSSASASEDANGLPTATATGQLTTLTLSPSASALPIPVTPKSTLATTLGGVLGTLPPLPTSSTPLGTVLGLVAAAANTSLTSLVSASIGSSTSTVSATATTTTAKGEGSGSQLNLLTGLGAGGGALLTISVGQAGTTVTLDRTTGQVTASDTPAVVSVTLSSPVTGTQSYPIAPGTSQTFLSGTPLQTTVAAGSGTATSGAGKGSASADGVTIDALQGIGASTPTGTNGGVGIDLTSSSATATGTAPVVTTVASTPPPAPVVTGATTVHTGEYWAGSLPILLLGLSMFLGLALIARRRLLLVAHHMIHLARPAAPPAGGPSSGPASGTLPVSPSGSGPARRRSH